MARRRVETASSRAPHLSQVRETLPAASRFIVLSKFNAQAVLDRETGLVWERAPSPTRYVQIPPPNTFGGTYPDDYCFGPKTGGRMGWRLPSSAELTSLIDATQSFPALPAGHSFQRGGNTEGYWMSTRYCPERFAAGRRFVGI